MTSRRGPIGKPTVARSGLGPGDRGVQELCITPAQQAHSKAYRTRAAPFPKACHLTLLSNAVQVSEVAMHRATRHSLRLLSRAQLVSQAKISHLPSRGSAQSVSGAKLSHQAALDKMSEKQLTARGLRSPAIACAEQPRFVKKLFHFPHPILRLFRIVAEGCGGLGLCDGPKVKAFQRRKTDKRKKTKTATKQTRKQIRRCPPSQAS